MLKDGENVMPEIKAVNCQRPDFASLFAYAHHTQGNYSFHGTKSHHLPCLLKRKKYWSFLTMKFSRGSGDAAPCHSLKQVSQLHLLPGEF